MKKPNVFVETGKSKNLVAKKLQHNGKEHWIMRDVSTGQLIVAKKNESGAFILADLRDDEAKRVMDMYFQMVREA